MNIRCYSYLTHINNYICLTVTSLAKNEINAYICKIIKFSLLIFPLLILFSILSFVFSSENFNLFIYIFKCLLFKSSSLSLAEKKKKQLLCKIMSNLKFGL